MKTIIAFWAFLPPARKHLLVGLALLALGLILLAAKAVTGGSTNGQTLAGLLAGFTGLVMVYDARAMGDQ